MVFSAIILVLVAILFKSSAVSPSGPSAVTSTLNPSTSPAHSSLGPSMIPTLKTSSPSVVPTTYSMPTAPTYSPSI
eukprot:gene34338-44358_t